MHVAEPVLLRVQLLASGQPPPLEAAEALALRPQHVATVLLLLLLLHLLHLLLCLLLLPLLPPLLLLLLLLPATARAPAAHLQ
jgi:hypothetical protein